MAKLRQPQLEQKPERRSSGRISIEEINQLGADQFTKKVLAGKKPKDRRAWWEKLLDIVDLPRNLVAQTVADIAGVDKSKLKSGEGALGLKRVYMSDVLNKLGVKNKVARGIAGFVGDVAIDPLTYLSAGATSGMKIAGIKGAKLGGKAQRGLRAAMKSGVAGDDLLKALGTNKDAFRKLALKHGNKLSKRGGELTARLGKQMLKADGGAARAFAKKGMLKARPIARIPFTQITAGKMPGLIGKSKATKKAFQVVEGFDNIADLLWLKEIDSIEDGAKAANAIVKLKAAARATDDPVQKKKFVDQAKTLVGKVNKAKESLPELERLRVASKHTLGKMAPSAKSLKGLAKGLAVAPDAPELLKLGKAAKLGTAVPFEQKTGVRGLLQKLGKEKRRAFGPEKSIGRTQFAGHKMRGTVAPYLAERVSYAEESKKYSDLIRKLVNEGLGSEDEVRRTVGLAGYNAGVEGVSELDDVARWSAQPEVKKIIDRPDVKEFIADQVKTQDIMAIREGREPLHQLHRITSEEAGRAIGATEERIGTAGPKPNALGQQASEKARRQAIEFTDEFGNKHLVPDESKHASLARERGWTEGDKFNVSGVQMDKFAREGQLERLVGQPKLADFYDNDLAMSTAKRTRQHEQRMAATDFQKWARQHGTQVPNDLLSDPQYAGLAVPKNLPPDHPFIKQMGGMGGVYPSGKSNMVWAFEPQMAAFMDDYADTFRPEAVNAVLRGTDASLKFFKWHALMHPAYVVRNVFENAFGMVRAGINPVKAIKLRSSKMGNAIHKALKHGSLKNPEWVAKEGSELFKLGGRKYRLADLVKGAIDNNIELGTRTIHEISKEGIGAGKSLETVARGLKKAGSDAVFAVRDGNTFAEQSMRLGAWLDAIASGEDLASAGQRVIYAMPDMSDLTRVERQWGTRIFPWYRWVRHNGALQLFHYLPEQPSWLANAGRLKHLGEAMFTPDNVPDDLRPQWQREQGAMQLTGDEKGGAVWMLRNWLPYEEVINAAGIVGDPQGTARAIAGQTRPVIKGLFELGAGKDYFQQRDLEPVSPGGLPGDLLSGLTGGPTRTAATSFGRIRPVTEWFKMRKIWKEGNPGLALSRLPIGGSIQQADAAKGLTSLGYQLREEAQGVRKELNAARDAGDAELANELTRKLIEIFYEMYKRGIDGVPKSTVAMFEAMNDG